MSGSYLRLNGRWKELLWRNLADPAHRSGSQRADFCIPMGDDAVLQVSKKRVAIRLVPADGCDEYEVQHVIEMR